MTKLRDEFRLMLALTKNYWHELVIAVRFGLVGLIATIFHIVVVSFLLVQLKFPPQVANTFAFLTAFGISFVGNYIWTFKCPGNPVRAMRRFLLISGSAFVLNSLFLATMLNAGWFTPLFSTIFAAAIIPVFTYSGSRLWGFRSKGKQI